MSHIRVAVRVRPPSHDEIAAAAAAGYRDESEAAINVADNQITLTRYGPGATTAAKQALLGSKALSSSLSSSARRTPLSQRNAQTQFHEERVSTAFGNGVAKTKTKNFTFDHVFGGVNGLQGREGQREIFDTYGPEILDNVWEGA